MVSVRELTAGRGSRHRVLSHLERRECAMVARVVHPFQIEGEGDIARASSEAEE